MTLKAILAFHSFLPLLLCYSVPLDATNPSNGLDTTTEVVVITAIVTSSVEVLETSTILLPPSASSSLSPTDSPSPTPPAPSSTSSYESTPFIAPTPATTPPPALPTTIVDFVTVTDILTPPPVTVTVWDPPVTTTEIITTTASPSPTSSTGSATAWTAPAQMTDLGCFKVTDFAYGQDNMQIVQGIPAEASASTPAAVGAPSAAPDPNTPSAAAAAPVVEAADASAPPGPGAPPPATTPQWDNSSSVLQLLYPSGSVNPASQPQGGADFYASPLDLSSAQNISMSYSVFFPADFDWVLAGKLPGIYGGHRTCSGGDDALSCFSTRLMWREGGAGELYLYAPKDKQTDDLCSTPPLSVCDQEYGLSVGRGSFNFTPGAWTNVRQTVSLNTPGQQDGGFMLEVNGQTVMNRNDVFYRDVPSAAPPPDDDQDDSQDPDYASTVPNSDQPTVTYIPPAATPPPPVAPVVTPAPAPVPAPAAPSDDDGLGDLLGPLLGSRDSHARRANRRRQYAPAAEGPPSDSDGNGVTSTTSINAIAQEFPSSTTTNTATTTVMQAAGTQTVWSQATATTTAYAMMQAFGGDDSEVQAQDQDSKPIGFTGLFFSTFFGGHEAQYATPRDQYTWFKDFSMTINA